MYIDISLLILVPSTSTADECCENVMVKSEHERATNVTGEYNQDPARPTAYKHKNKKMYLYKNAQNNNYWTVS